MLIAVVLNEIKLIVPLLKGKRSVSLTLRKAHIKILKIRQFI